MKRSLQEQLETVSLQLSVSAPTPEHQARAEQYTKAAPVITDDVKSLLAYLRTSEGLNDFLRRSHGARNRVLETIEEYDTALADDLRRQAIIRR